MWTLWISGQMVVGLVGGGGLWLQDERCGEGSEFLRTWQPQRGTPVFRELCTSIMEFRGIIKFRGIIMGFREHHWSIRAHSTINDPLFNYPGNSPIRGRVTSPPTFRSSSLHLPSPPHPHQPPPPPFTHPPTTTHHARPSRPLRHVRPLCQPPRALLHLHLSRTHSVQTLRQLHRAIHHSQARCRGGILLPRDYRFFRPEKAQCWYFPRTPVMPSVLWASFIFWGTTECSRVLCASLLFPPRLQLHYASNPQSQSARKSQPPRARSQKSA